MKKRKYRRFQRHVSTRWCLGSIREDMTRAAVHFERHTPYLLTRVTDDLYFVADKSTRRVAVLATASRNHGVPGDTLRILICVLCYQLYSRVFGFIRLLIILTLGIILK